MCNKAWYKQQNPNIKLHELLNLVLYLVFPNLFFLLLAFYTETSRPLINFDYLVVLFLLVLPWTWVRIIGGIGLVIAIVIDILMLIIQIFPFVDLSAILYLVDFIPIAPKKYIFGTLFLLIGGGGIFFLTLKFAKKFSFPYPHFMIIVLIIISYACMTLGLTYTSFQGIMGRDNYYFAHSQAELYKKIKQSKFILATDTTPEFQPITDQSQHVVSQLQQPYSSKILYIVAESWGELRNKEAQKAIFKNINQNSHLFEFIAEGSLHTVGATVAGELREICSLELINSGFAFSKLKAEQFANCLPNKLVQRGYKTVALHGTSGLLYDRTTWYKHAGFGQRYFGEHFMQLKRCTAFKGVCDTVLMQVVAQTFKQNAAEKIFFYWMTLTSHQPYSEKDIYNQRFDCKKYNMNVQGDACHNSKLQTQFLDELAELVKKPEMKGVEVIVVGDHQPPLWGGEFKHFHHFKVSYLHFKVK
ncbi:sulfatase-like hydrolase/transferase [Acinetobacter indicus]|uniref:sulfatase-like hydrolase/transferase n=1 Tax=Acinetobacter indicus TaxID=756892 RepID=UPI0035BC6E6E